MLRRGPDAISPTAHYTGHVWSRNGLSHPELGTIEGRLMFDVLAPTFIASRLLGGPTLEGLLLARHRIIDQLLAERIETGKIRQVVEVACGMSPRGWRFAERYGDRLTYVEADLPEMAARKRRALEKIGSLDDHHRVEEVNALSDESVAALTDTLDRRSGLAIVTEGLLTYFPEDDVNGMLRRFATELQRFRSGLYLADVRLSGERQSVLERGFQAALSTFVRRQVHRHFGDEAAAENALLAAGFDEAHVHRAGRHPATGDAGRDPGAERLHILEGITA